MSLLKIQNLTAAEALANLSPYDDTNSNTTSYMFLDIDDNNMLKGIFFDSTAVNDKVIRTLSGGVSGTYTPTLTIVTNLDTAVSGDLNFYQVGSFVHVSGVITLDATAAAVYEVGVSLPIASDFSAITEGSGVGSPVLAAAAGQYYAYLEADDANDRLALKGITDVTTAIAIHIEATYEILA